MLVVVMLALIGFLCLLRGVLGRLLLGRCLVVLLLVGRSCGVCRRL
nr:MAG TPA: Pre-glycoprotein polyprotein GP complex, Antibody virus, glycoprotein, antibody, VIRAL [Caudoviricetes sp.]